MPWLRSHIYCFTFNLNKFSCFRALKNRTWESLLAELMLRSALVVARDAQSLLTPAFHQGVGYRVCLSCGTTALLPQMAFMAVINPLIWLLVRRDCSCADFPDKRPVVVSFWVQVSVGVGLSSFRLQQLCVGALFSGPLVKTAVVRWVALVVGHCWSDLHGK